METSLAEYTAHRIVKPFWKEGMDENKGNLKQISARQVPSAIPHRMSRENVNTTLGNIYPTYSLYPFISWLI
jgi:hypothetical protein